MFISWFVASIRNVLRHRATVRELQAFNDRELADLGRSRTEI